MFDRNPYQMPGSLGGLQILQDDKLVVGPFEDWSGVRSPGRAKRRRARGHRQRIRLYYKPDPKFYRMGNTIVCHPANYYVLQRQIAVRT